MEIVCSGTLPPPDAAAFADLFDYDDWVEEQHFSMLHKIVLGLLPFQRTLQEELSLSTSMINIRDARGRTPLAWAADCGNVSMLRTLLDHGTDFSCDPNSKWSPLHYAARSKTPDCLATLLESGAPADVRDLMDNSPLYIATFYQDDPTYVSLLLRHGADIECRTTWGPCPLGGALLQQNLKTARYLISEGADPNARGIGNVLLLSQQAATNCHHSISVLLDGGANPALIDEHGETPLHALARSGDSRSIEIFQAADLAQVDPEAKNNAGLTPWDLMSQREGVTAEVRFAFGYLMSKLYMQAGSQEFFDAIESLPDHE